MKTVAKNTVSHGYLHFLIRSADSLAAEASCSALEASVVSMLSLNESIAAFTLIDIVATYSLIKCNLGLIYIVCSNKNDDNNSNNDNNNNSGNNSNKKNKYSNKKNKYNNNPNHYNFFKCDW